MARGVQFEKESASRIARVVRAVEAFPQDLGKFRRRQRSFSEFPWTLLAFGFAYKSADLITIKPGSLRIHGTGIFAVAETDVTLTGATEFIYLAHTRDHSTTNIAHSTTEPETTSNELRVPLYKFAAVVTGVYTLDRILNMGDINFDTPLRA